eukprot:gb/GEZN01001976.1/.p1 GENE.gb/GEZN01001976.1/~~gb/GEZN01001976.1/.p1  ORF type:complete len:866 (-),score=130.92 gb/GEZN01001976.1/:117-2495(-)
MEAARIESVMDSYDSTHLRHISIQFKIGQDEDLPTVEVKKSLQDILTWLPAVEKALQPPDSISNNSVTQQATLEKARITALQQAVQTARDMGATTATHTTFAKAEQLLQELIAASGRPANVESDLSPTFALDKSAQEDGLSSSQIKLKQKKAITAQKVQQEILQTEKSYVKALMLLVSKYIKPLAEEAATLGIKPEQLKVLSSNIEALTKMHMNLRNELDKAPEQAATILHKYAPMFKIYIEYLNGYDPMLQVMNKLTMKSDRVSKFFQSVREEIEKETGQNLFSYLIMPVQRVPRYVLLLKELQRNTDHGQKEAHAIELALAEMSAVASNINEGKRQYEITSRVQDVQQRLRGRVDLLAPHRRLLREGPLRVEISKLAGGETPVLSRENSLVLSGDGIPSSSVPPPFTKSNRYHFPGETTPVSPPGMLSPTGGLGGLTSRSMLTSATNILAFPPARPNVVFLFNDLIVFCSPRLKLIHRCDLLHRASLHPEPSGLWTSYANIGKSESSGLPTSNNGKANVHGAIHEDDEGEDVGLDDHSFELVYPGYKITFYAQNSAEKREWHQAVDTAIQSAKVLYKTSQERSDKAVIHKMTLIIRSASDLPIGDRIKRSSDPYVQLKINTPQPSPFSPTTAPFLSSHSSLLSSASLAALSPSSFSSSSSSFSSTVSSTVSSVLKTAVITRCLHPVWNEQFCLPTDRLPDKQLEFEVLDQDIILRDDFLGRAKLDLSAIKIGEEELQHFTLPLSGGLCEKEKKKRLKKGGSPKLSVSVKIEAVKDFAPTLTEMQTSERVV